MARRKRNLIDAALHVSAAALCVLDGERRIRMVSPGLVQQTNWTAEELEGLICEPSVADSSAPVEFLTSVLAPSPDVLDGLPQTVSVMLPRKADSALRTSLMFLPVADETGIVDRIIVLSQPEARLPQSMGSLTQKLHAELTAQRLEFRQRFSAGSFMGDSSHVRTALEQAELLVKSDCDYAIVGPSGTGRRHLAKLIHVSGLRHEESLVTLDCRLLSAEEVLDALRMMQRDSSESSTSPHQLVGTLVLADADQCPREVQKWILEDLWTERENIRIVAISSEPLSVTEEAGWVLPEFREMFATLQITLPSLHHRPTDISLLAQHFIEDCRRTLDTSAEGMSEEFESELRFYRWPGNVRELRQIITDACQNSFSRILQVDDLPFAFRAGLQAQQMPDAPGPAVVSLEELVQRFETDVLQQTLQACDGNKAEAARRLGMTRPRLYRRLKTLGLDQDD